MQQQNTTEPDVPCFKAGDGRSTEVSPLTAIHTIWIRYHNHLVNQFMNINSHWKPEQLYHEARKIISAMHQKISFYDYLPLIIGQSGASALGMFIIIYEWLIL